MAKFFDWIINSTAKTKSTGTNLDCKVFVELAQEFSLRKLAFLTCTNMIANAIGKCEFRTYRDGKEIREREYYLWNVEPNPNQNSTAFLHKMITKLYEDNEVLVISSKAADGFEYLNVADTFTQKWEYPVEKNAYINVTVGDRAYGKTFYEDEVLHLKLNHNDIKPVLYAMYSNYSNMIAAAEKAFGYDFGQHWKVHIDQIAQGDANFEEDFNEMMRNQIIPFLKSDNGVLTEYDGYKWENMSKSGNSNSRDIRAMYDDIFDFTAKAFNIPSVLQSGNVADTSEAINRWLTTCIDPLADQLQEEINRKRYGYNGWRKKSYLRVDTSTLMHFDMFEQANNIDKLISSGVFTINMILEAAGMATVNESWADEHFITKNYAPIDEVLTVKGGE